MTYDIVAEPEHELRVAASTDVKMLASCIVQTQEAKKKVILSCIGMPAVSQACKSVAIANGQAAPQGFMFVMIPSFHVARFPDKETSEVVERTGMRFAVLRLGLGA